MFVTSIRCFGFINPLPVSAPAAFTLTSRFRRTHHAAMKIVIPGGSGQVGTLLARAFHKDGHEVVVLSRSPRANTPWRVIAWDGRTAGNWSTELEGTDAVINLAGRSVNCRYHEKNRREIMDSRIDSTRAVGDAIARAKNPPRVWLQAATATIYAHRYDAPNDEATGIVGGSEKNAPDTWRFSIDIATAWERALDGTGPLPRTRKVLMRSAITMSPRPRRRVRHAPRPGALRSRRHLRQRAAIRLLDP